jgi:beta-galactosidase
MRETINLDTGWDFVRDDCGLQGIKATALQQVNLPHTWNAFDGQDGGSDYHRGRCWYRKNFVAPESVKSRRAYFEFKGINSVTSVFMDGQIIGSHRGGFSTFRCEVPGGLRPGPHELVISADNSHDETVYPLMADFTFFGGIYRSINLILVKDLAFDLSDAGSSGVRVFQRSVTAAVAELDVISQVSIANAKGGVLRCELRDADGFSVAVSESAIPGAAGKNNIVEIRQHMRIERPQLWNGLAAPYLQTLTCELSTGSGMTDRMELPVGLRSIAVDGEGLLRLNGEILRLRGVSRHQDRLDKGWAIGRADMEEDLALLMELGANSVRLAHYQHDDYFYELCDRAGLIVWAEIPYISRSSKVDPTGENARMQLKELIRQTMNHPSIVTWGVQNEVTIDGKENGVDAIVADLAALSRAEDPTRPVTQAQVGHLEVDDPLNRVSDLVAYNVYFGWYYDTCADLGPWIEKYHRANPGRPLGISEYGAEANIAYHTEVPKVNDYTEEYQALYHEQIYATIERHDELWGTWVWNMFDFASDFRDEGGVKGRNNKGLVTFDRKTRKDAFYYYKARWSREPFIHICSTRFSRRASARMTVKVYSNLDSVELFVNGRFHGSAKVAGGIAVFQGIQLGWFGSRIEARSGDISDSARFRRIFRADKSFTCPKKTGLVSNWFGEDGKPIELSFPEGRLSIRDALKDILATPGGEAVLRLHLAPLFSHPMFEMAKSFSIERLAAFKADEFPPALLVKLNHDLNTIEKAG